MIFGFLFRLSKASLRFFFPRRFAIHRDPLPQFLAYIFERFGLVQACLCMTIMYRKRGRRDSNSRACLHRPPGPKSGTNRPLCHAPANKHTNPDAMSSPVGVSIALFCLRKWGHEFWGCCKMEAHRKIPLSVPCSRRSPPRGCSHSNRLGVWSVGIPVGEAVRVAEEIAICSRQAGDDSLV